MIFIIFSNSLSDSLYEAKEILKNDQGLCLTILVRNKVGPRSKKDLSVRGLTDKHRCKYFKLSVIDGD